MNDVIQLVGRVSELEAIIKRHEQRIKDVKHELDTQSKLIEAIIEDLKQQRRR